MHRGDPFFRQRPAEIGRGKELTPAHDDSARERNARNCAEQIRLKAWAEANGKLKGKLPPEDDRGGEHIVHYNAKTDRYEKIR